MDKDIKMDLGDTNHNVPFQLPPLPRKLRNRHQESEFHPSLPALPLKSPSKKKTNKIDFLTGISDNLLVECRKLNSDNQKLKSLLKQKVKENEDLAEKITHQAIFSKKLEQEQQRLLDSNWSLETKLQDTFDEASLAKSSSIKFSEELKLKTDQVETLNREMESLKNEKLSLKDKICTLEGRSTFELEELKNMNTSLNEENELLHHQVNSLKAQLEQKFSIHDKKPFPVAQSEYLEQESLDTVSLNNLSATDTVNKLRISLMKIENEKKALEDLLKTHNSPTEISAKVDGSKISYPMSMKDSRSIASCQWDKEIQNPLKEDYIHRSSSIASGKKKELVNGDLEKEVAEFNDNLCNMEATQFEAVSSTDGTICQLSDQKTFEKSCNQVSSRRYEPLESEILEVRKENKQLRIELSAMNNEAKFLTSEKVSACELAQKLEIKLFDSEKQILVLEPSIAQLRKELKSAQASHSKSLEVKDTIINNLRMQVSELELSFDELTVNRKNISSKVKTLEAYNDKLQDNITALKSKYQQTIDELTVTKSIATESQQKLSEQMQANLTLSADVSSLKTQEEELNCKISLLELEKETLNKKLNSLAVLLDESQKVENSCRESVVKSNKRLKESNREHSSKDDSVLSLTKQLEISEKNTIFSQIDFDRLKELADLSNSKIIDLESQLNACKTQIDSKDCHFLKLSQEKEKLALKFDESTRKLNEMINFRDEQSKHILELEIEQKNTIYKYESLQTEMMSLKQSLIENNNSFEEEKLNLISQISDAKEKSTNLQNEVSNLTEQLTTSESKLSSLIMDGENLVPKTERQLPLSQVLERDQFIDPEDEGAKIDAQGRKIFNLNETGVVLTGQNLPLERNASFLNSEFESLKKEVLDLEIAKSNLHKDISNMTNQKLSLENQKSSLEISNAELEVQLNSVQLKKAGIETLLLNSEDKKLENNLKCMSVNQGKSKLKNTSVALDSNPANTESCEVIKNIGCKLESAIGDSQSLKKDHQQDTDLLSKKTGLLLLQQAPKDELKQVSVEPKKINGIANAADEKFRKELKNSATMQKESGNELKNIPVACERISTKEKISPECLNIGEITSQIEQKTAIVGCLIDKFSTQEDKMIEEFNLSTSQNGLDVESQELLRSYKILSEKINQLLMLWGSSKSMEENIGCVLTTQSELCSSTKHDNELPIDNLKAAQPKGAIPNDNQKMTLSSDDSENCALIGIPQIKYNRSTYALDHQEKEQKDTEKKYLDKIIDNKCCVVELDELQKLKECQNVNTAAFRELLDDNNLLAISKKAYVATTIFKHPDPDHVVVLPITYYNKLTRSHEVVKKTKDREALDSSLDAFSSTLPCYHVKEQSNVVHDPGSTIARTLSPAVTCHTEGTVSTNISLTNRNMMPLITQTVIGEYLYKYHRKLGIFSSISESRHERYFWVHPYSMTLYWSDINPVLSNPSDNRVKALAITGVSSVDDNNPLPPGLYHKSIIIQSIERSIKITCASRQRHNIWLNSIKYLLARSTEELEFDEDPELSSMAIRVTAQDSAITRSGSFRHNLPRSRSVADRRLTKQSSICN
ncbi:GQ67_02157T0 [Komagataella phaffii]|nr:GQ67_02157T0 [Komagataella phaffii]AOA66317.1 GQ68_02172T0 [Komagataella phaffii GS115]